MTGPASRPLDLPGTACSLESRRCSEFLAGSGGFDVHHGWPVSMGGPVAGQQPMSLCPSHHRRQHALIRALVEGAATWEVQRRFDQDERRAAAQAIAYWRSAGSPPIQGWSTPAARKWTDADRMRE